jgi:lysozyme family protein
MAGIARKQNPQWQGWKLVDELKRQTGFPAILRTNTQLAKLVVSFYKAQFWDKLSLDTVRNQDIADKLYDIGVNCGIGFAGKALQRTLNVANQNGRFYPDLVVDGNIGPKTIAALNAHPRQDVVFKCLNTIQGEHYIELAEGNKTQEDFINGWFTNRIAGIA